MRFLTVADRELRSAARQKITYRTRWVTAALFFLLLLWVLWAFHGLTNKRAAPHIFGIFSVLTFLYCLFLGAARTADSISAERREGTLGLLFLTNLNSAEILAGKLCSTALASVYGLMAIFPILALPLLIGGITFEFVARTMLALLNGILFALAAGFLASVLCKRQFTTLALAMGMVIAVGGGLMLAAAAADSYAPTRWLAHWLATFSPLYTLIAADNSRLFGPNRFWYSAATVAGISMSMLGLTTLVLARTWRDRVKSVGVWRRLWFRRRSERVPSARRAGLRRRLLAINPVFWLAAPKPVSAPVMMLLALVLTAVTAYGAAPFFGRVMAPGAKGAQVLGHLFAWLWTGMAIHALVLYYAAMIASQRLAEDKQTGALELLLSTPISERAISRGLWLAYGRRMLFPALLAVLVHVFFLWICMVMASFDPPGQLPSGARPGEIFWSALFNQPLRGRMLHWEFGFMLRISLLILLQLIVSWVTLGWVGRWLGLRMKHPGFAPMSSLVLLIAPPVLLFSFACYMADKFHLTRLPDRQFLPMMMWLGLAIGMGHCAALSVWAATRLRAHLRSVAMSRYQPLPAWRWRLPSRRLVRRLAVGAAALAAVVSALVFGYYGYQNWRSKVAWRSFQTAVKQRGEPLSVAVLLPAPVPNNVNFACSAAFLGLVNRTNREMADLFQRMKPFDLAATPAQGNSVLMEWNRQMQAPLLPFVNWNRQRSRSGSEVKRQENAEAILQELQAQSGALKELTAAATRLPVLQVSTNRDAGAVLNPPKETILTLERLHLVFQVRACALLAVGRNAEAAEDVLSGLRLARLARQLPDTRATVRVQALLARSLQPLWEGLSQQAWTEPQLADFQRELTGFNLLADYTNAIRRVVLAQIEVWRAIPDSTNSELVLPASEGGFTSDPGWRLQPRAWWYDNCIQLDQAGREAIEQVDIAAGRFQRPINWSYLSGLPLDFPCRELLQQSMWWGANPGMVPFAQTAVNQAAIACALERFRLAHSVYPKTLEELVPALMDHIPHDAISGRPMIYQPGERGSFILRGVGPNGTDDRKQKVSDDWLWTYSANQPSGNK